MKREKSEKKKERNYVESYALRPRLTLIVALLTPTSTGNCGAIPGRESGGGKKRRGRGGKKKGGWGKERDVELDPVRLRLQQWYRSVNGGSGKRKGGRRVPQRIGLALVSRYAIVLVMFGWSSASLVRGRKEGGEKKKDRHSASTSIPLRPVASPSSFAFR